MKGLLFVCAILSLMLAYVLEASAIGGNTRVNVGNNSVRVNGPGIGNRTLVRGVGGANVNVNSFRNGANVNVNGFNNHGFNNVNVNSFRRGANVNVNGFGYGVNNFGAFAVTRPSFRVFNYAPPIAVQSFGVPVIQNFSSYGYGVPAQSLGVQSYGYQVQGVGFANPGCGRLLLGY